MSPVPASKSAQLGLGHGGLGASHLANGHAVRQTSPLSAARPLAELMLPGIAQVRAQAEPFARAWQAANKEARESSAPLWVALGDSMTQGIGAASIHGGWVGQLQAPLTRAGSPLRVVNLSVTGAGIADVLASQVPELAQLASRTTLVTVLAGANDMFPRHRRQHAVTAMAGLLTALPAGKSIVATLPRRNPAALAINALIDSAATQGMITVAELRGMTLRSLIGTRAADLFHPNERGYAGLADTFAQAVHAHLA